LEDIGAAELYDICWGTGSRAQKHRKAGNGFRVRNALTRVVVHAEFRAVTPVLGARSKEGIHACSSRSSRGGRSGHQLFDGFMAPALARDTWRISLQYPGSDMMVAHIRNFAEKVRERTGGAIKSEVFTDYTLFKQGQELPAMQRGNLDIAVLNTGDIEQQIAEYSIFSSGYLFRDHNHFRAVFDGPIGKDSAIKSWISST
jgi:hypothetical protein